jgi:hypothetical protein
MPAPSPRISSTPLPPQSLLLPPLTIMFIPTLTFIPAPTLSPLPPTDNGYDDDEDGNNSFISFSSFNNIRLKNRAP